MTRIVISPMIVGLAFVILLNVAADNLYGQRRVDPRIRTDRRVTAERRVPVGSSAMVKFKLTDPAKGEPAGDVPDVTVLYYRSDGRGRTVVPARALGDGLYEATVKVGTAATYYVFVGSRSRNIKYSDLPFFSLMGVPAKAAKATK